MNSKKKILLINLGAFGDSLMATTIARQIKKDYPDCYLIWAISKKFSQVLMNNPDVDKIWIVKSRPCQSLTGEVWIRVKKVANRLQELGKIDLVYDSQIYPDNRVYYDGTTRSSMFRCYPHAISVPVMPVVHLLAQEIENAHIFAENNKLTTFTHVILFECAPSSNQSVLNLELGLIIAKKIINIRDDVIVIISTHHKFSSFSPRIVDGSSLTFRENAALSHYCTLQIGCSSGISWLLTSNAAKKINQVQFLNRKATASSFASIAYDFNYFGLATDHILESGCKDHDRMVHIINHALNDFTSARNTYHEIFKPSFWDCLYFIDYRNIRRASLFFKTVSNYRTRNRFSWRDYLNLYAAFLVILKLARRVWASIIDLGKKRLKEEKA